MRIIFCFVLLFLFFSYIILRGHASRVSNFTRKDRFMKIFRSVTAMLLLLSLLLSAVGCGKGYKPVKSTEEELATTLSFGKELDVPYELYRFYFLSELALSGKDPAKMGAEEKAALFAELQEKTLEELSYLYAIKSLCVKYGVDFYSKELDEKVQKVIDGLVDGTYGGDHEKYLADLAKSGLNDSAFRTIYRFELAERALGEHVRDKSIIKSDAHTVKKYIESDECIRVSWIFISDLMLANYNQMQLDTIEMEAQAVDNEAFLKMTHKVIPDAYTDEELERGFYIGRYHLDPQNFSALTEAAFALTEGETSDWVHSGEGLDHGEGAGMYLIRRLPKDEAYVNDTNNLADFAEYYLLNAFFQMVEEERARLLTGVKYDSSFSALSFDTIKMAK